YDLCPPTEDPSSPSNSAQTNKPLIPKTELNNSHRSRAQGIVTNETLYKTVGVQCSKHCTYPPPLSPTKNLQIILILEMLLERCLAAPLFLWIAFACSQGAFTVVFRAIKAEHSHCIAKSKQITIEKIELDAPNNNVYIAKPIRDSC
ncbi:MAG: hypothetical protein AAF985_03450, partial [Bacteroidota bacterium]